jgi:glycosyltransferase involved in cell wall biosynthesis
MVLIDAIFINNGGGKILLDYLISENNKKTNLELHYIIDSRIENNHCEVLNGTFEYLSSNWRKRRKYYLLNKKIIKKVFCFANIPPNIKLDIPVFTYFHQPLFLKIESELPIIKRLLFCIKTIVLSSVLKNTDKWVVQSSLIQSKLSEKYNIQLDNILIIPFYPSINKPDIVIQRAPIFLYVSNGEPHKNHKRLLASFVLFYDKKNYGELHLTIEDTYFDLINEVNGLKEQGYPIVNHGFLSRENLSDLYAKSLYFIFPSLTESFGLGIIEALENGCLILGADRPYMHAICKPNIIFNPESIEDMCNGMINATNNQFENSEQYVQNKIEDLITLLK